MAICTYTVFVDRTKYTRFCALMESLGMHPNCVLAAFAYQAAKKVRVPVDYTNLQPMLGLSFGEAEIKLDLDVRVKATATEVFAYHGLQFCEAFELCIDAALDAGGVPFPIDNKEG